MKATYSSQYRKADASGKRFVFKVSGTPDELEAYKKAQAGNYREDEDHTPLFFLTEWLNVPGQRPKKQVIKTQFILQVNRKGDKVFIDDSRETMQLNEAIYNVDKLADAIRSKMADEWVNGGSAPAPTQLPPPNKEIPEVFMDPDKALESLKINTELGPKQEHIEETEGVGKL